MAEYNKARASTNYSFHVVLYLPKSMTTLVTLYLIYIRPFAKMFVPQCSVASAGGNQRGRDKEGSSQRIKASRSTTSQKRDPPESSMRRTRTWPWIVVISFVPTNLSINAGRAWNCPKFCRRNPSNDWESRLICRHGGISSSASQRHIWRRLLPFSPKTIKVVKKCSNGIYFITFSHGRPDIKEESMCRRMV